MSFMEAFGDIQRKMNRSTGQDELQGFGKTEQILAGVQIECANEGRRAVGHTAEPARGKEKGKQISLLLRYPKMELELHSFTGSLSQGLNPCAWKEMQEKVFGWNGRGTCPLACYLQGNLNCDFNSICTQKLRSPTTTRIWQILVKPGWTRLKGQEGRISRILAAICEGAWKLLSLNNCSF